MTNWIRVSQDLPEYNRLVQVANNSSKYPEDNWVLAGYMHENGKWYNQFEGPKHDPDIIVTHWAPMLPMPV